MYIRHVYTCLYMYIRQRIWILALNVKSTSDIVLLGRIFLWGDWSLFFTLRLQRRLEGLSQPSWHFWCEDFIYLNTCTCVYPPYSLSCLPAVPVPPGRCCKLHDEAFKKTRHTFENCVFLVKWLSSVHLGLTLQWLFFGSCRSFHTVCSVLKGQTIPIVVLCTESHCVKCGTHLQDVVDETWYLDPSLSQVSSYLREKFLENLENL